MSNCKMPLGLRDDNGDMIREGDEVTFAMPGFCTGDYTFPVKKDRRYGGFIFEGAPSGILRGCYGITITKRNGVPFESKLKKLKGSRK